MLRAFPLLGFALGAALDAGLATASVLVRDDAGQALRLAAPARRIVSLAPHITELLFAVEAGSQVVGVMRFSDYPAAATKIPVVADYNAINLEAILALKPDLVIAWQSGNPPAQVERLRQLGIPVFWSQPHALSEVADSLEKFGRLTGHVVAGQAAAERFRSATQALRARYAGRQPVSVFVQLWDRPITTINRRHLISDVLALCGGRNPFAEVPVPTPVVSVEAVLKANPEALLTLAKQDDLATLAIWRRWQQLAAVRLDAFYAIDPDLLSRHSPRILMGAEQICQALDKVRVTRGRTVAPSRSAKLMPTVPNLPTVSATPAPTSSPVP